MLQILKASAGSGKTYALAREYIRLLVAGESPDAYRHVLAVTFTNKATDEMKRRILKELYTLSRNPEASPYYKAFVPAVVGDAATLQRRAQRQLSGILHDYSAFAVSTIDRFFQQTLRAFSREIGQFSTYQVQLDRDALVSESVDRVLDGVSEENGTLLHWLTASAQDQLQQKGHFSLEEGLQDMAKSMQTLPPGQGIYSKERLTQLRGLCREVRQRFAEKVQLAAQRCLDVLASVAVQPEDSNRGFLKALYDYARPSPQDAVRRPTDSFVSKAASPDQWFAKSKASLRDRTEGLLEAPLQAFLALFGQSYQEYLTAGTILGQLYGLGVAEELRTAFTDIQKEKNVISLDDSNAILRGIIDGTPTPFIYEKLGVRYEDFLLDEFQDTAEVQWDNFRPLLHGSQDSGNDSLVVGDVKQSIYRWRGSDWELLGSRLAQEFREKEEHVLDENHRTCREIVQFNNAFFQYAAAKLDELLGLPSDAPDSVSSLYADVVQQVRFPDPAPGSVDVCFPEDQLSEVLSTLEEIRSRGGKWADVAILVRQNKQGSAVADALIAAGIPVVSDDSLFVKASVTVRRLVSELAMVDAPRQEDKPSVAGYMAASMGLDIPEHYHSLVDLAEGMLRGLREADAATFQAEVPYIQSFMDYLQDWMAVNGNNLGAFLKAWKDADPKIASPQTGDAVRVMTIHKAKGLEFPFVIFPFADKVELYKASSRWCKPAVEGTALEAADGLFRVSLNQESAQSLFQTDYHRERKCQAIDAINLFYVALTRAKYGLKIIAEKPSSKGLPFKNFSHLLYDFAGGEGHWGSPYPLASLRREAPADSLLPAGFDSFPADSGNRLSFSPEAADYFGEDGSFGPEASRRIRGNVLHGILARVGVKEDLEAAVQAAVDSGELPASLHSETLSFLTQRIDSVQERGWFSPAATIRSEAAILAPNGNEYRPDRVILAPDGKVQIVDYKFGVRKDSYLRQVGRYKSLYRALGYADVSGYLWYLDEGVVIDA